MAVIYLQLSGATLMLGFLLSLVTGCASFQQMEMPPLSEKLPVSHDYWGLIILQPTQLPALAKEKPYISAVLGLEKADQYQAAVSGYRTALRRWPYLLEAPYRLYTGKP